MLKEVFDELLTKVVSAAQAVYGDRLVLLVLYGSGKTMPLHIIDSKAETLASAYGYSKDTIVPVVEKLLRTSQLKIEDTQSAWTAFRTYQKGKADFADCLLGTTNRFGGCNGTVTFDQAASKLEDFQLL